MSRDQYVYTCLEDYCHAGWDTYRCDRVCPECGSTNIEVERTYLDDSHDYSGR